MLWRMGFDGGRDERFCLLEEIFMKRTFIDLKDFYRSYKMRINAPSGDTMLFSNREFWSDNDKENHVLC